MRAAIYCRYSSDNQNYGSIDAQLRAIQEYCAKESIAIVKTYIDEAESATSDNRPQFVDMIRDVAEKDFDIVIVHKLDRFARNRYDAAFYRRKLKDAGVRLISVLEPLDNSPESVILESVLEGMAEYYSLNLAREVKKGLREAALKCKHTGGVPPFGFDVTADKSYVINEVEADAIRMIFDMYAKGKSYNIIIAALNDMGLKTKRGNQFGKNSLNEILRNEKYKGTYIFNRSINKIDGKRNYRVSKDNADIIRIEGGMPAIISYEQFDAVQAGLQKRKHTKGANSAKRLYLLSGLIRCGECGAAMSGTTKRDGRSKAEHSYYQCTKRKAFKNCELKPVSKEFAENHIKQLLTNNLSDPDYIKKIASAMIKTRDQRLDTNAHLVVELRDELAVVTKKIDGMMRAITDGLYTSSMKEQMQDLEVRKEGLNHQISNITKANKSFYTEEVIVADLLKNVQKLKSEEPDDIAESFKFFVSEVVVTNEAINTQLTVTFDGGSEGN